MAASLQLYYYTIKQLRIRQLIYQLYYKLKPFKYHSSSKQQIPKIRLCKFSLPPFASKKLYLGSHTFNFINKLHSFPDKIDWTLKDHGDLWNYHLLYANYILDDTIAIVERLGIIKDLYQNINDKKLQLSPYPLSIRSVNVYYFLCANNINDNFLVNTLYNEYKSLNSFPEFHIDGNHLLENYISLLILSLAFCDEKNIHRNFKRLEILLKEQVLEDGAYCECSIMYHRQILYRLLLLFNVLLKIDPVPSYISFLQYTISKMLSWHQLVFRKDMPGFGDCASSLPDQEYAFAYYSSQLGIHPLVTNVFDCGLRIWNWENARAVIQLRDMKPSYQPGHCHADILHFILNIKNNAILVDIGISTYENSERRLYERSTVAHNTVSINGMNQSEIWSSFRVARRGKSQILHDTPDHIQANAVFFGNKYTHTRNFNKKTNALLIEDQINSNEAAIAYFHFDENIKIKMIKPGQFSIIELGIDFIFANYLSIELKTYNRALDFNICTEALKLEVGFTHSLKTHIHW